MKSKSLLVLTLIPFMVGCGSSGETSSSAPEIVTILDGQGRNVQMEKGKTNRVVCIGAGALRYYSYIGDLNKLVGVEEIDSGTTFGVGQALRPYYMAGYETFKNLPLIGKGGPMAQVADKEKILAVNPDVIVSFLSAEANNELQDAIKKPVIGLQQGPDGVFDTLTINSFLALGLVFDKSDRADSLSRYIEECREQFAKLTETTDTYYCGGIGNWGQTSMYGTMINFPVFKYAKVKSALNGLTITDKDGNPVKGNQVSIDMEKLQEANPDHIFMDTAGINGFITDYKKEGNATKYDNLKAFKNGETYQLMPYNAYYSNLEIQLMSTYYVASIAHSDFQVDIAAKSNEITEKFLGKEMYNDIKAHTYGMGGYQKVDLADIAKKAN